MAYATVERSRTDEFGRPQEFFEFQTGTTFHRFTSEPIDTIFQTNTYSAVAITRSNIRETGELDAGGVTVSVDKDNVLGSLLTSIDVYQPVTLTIYRKHITDLDDTTFIIIFLGQIKTVKRRGPEIEIECISVQGLLSRNIPRQSANITCMHMLYDNQCGILKTAERNNRAVTIIDDPTTKTIYPQITVPTADADGTFPGGGNFYGLGIVEFNGFETWIVRHIPGGVLDLLIPLPGLTDTDNVDLLPGCDRISSTCDQKFSNFENFGGFPQFPVKSPYNGRIA